MRLVVFLDGLYFYAREQHIEHERRDEQQKKILFHFDFDKLFIG